MAPPPPPSKNPNPNFFYPIHVQAAGEITAGYAYQMYQYELHQDPVISDYLIEAVSGARWGEGGVWVK